MTFWVTKLIISDNRAISYSTPLCLRYVSEIGYNKLGCYKEVTILEMTSCYFLVCIANDVIIFLFNISSCLWNTLFLKRCLNCVLILQCWTLFMCNSVGTSGDGRPVCQDSYCWIMILWILDVSLAQLPNDVSISTVQKHVFMA